MAECGDVREKSKAGRRPETNTKFELLDVGRPDMLSFFAFPLSRCLPSAKDAYAPSDARFGRGRALISLSPYPIAFLA